LKQQTADY